MQNPNTKRPYIIGLSAVAALGGLLFGFDTAIISGTIPYLKTYFLLSELMLGWTVGSILIGCALGAMLAGKLADDFGRRYVLLLCAVLFAISGLGAALAVNLESFICFRLIGGLGVGAAAMVSPMYIAESVPARFRGRMVSLYQLAIVSGILFAYGSNYFFEAFPDNWRWMFGVQVIPSVVFFCSLLLLPESPRWLIQNGRTTAALRALERSRTDEAGQEEHRQILSSLKQNQEMSLKKGLSVLFSRTNRKVVWIGIIIAMFQQITGVNSVLYYAPVIFRQTGIDTSSSILQTIAIGAVNVISTFLAIAFVDKVGRKKFMVVGSLVMGISLTGVALCFEHEYFQDYLVLILMLIYVGAFGCTLGAVTWIYLAEVFPGRIRGLGLSLATLSLWLTDFIVTYSFPYLTDRLGTASTMYLYAAFCALAFIFYLLKMPETKGKTLEEIEHLFI